jgi:predicted negative regulator of RcsB-dependent stress response
MTTKERMMKAKQLIEAQRYDEAKAILMTVDHPTADKWLEKLNKYSTKKNELSYEPIISQVTPYSTRHYTP